MYLITAIVNAHCVPNILEDLKASEIEGVTLSNVTGKGGFVESLINTEEHIRLDIVVSNDYFKELAKGAIRDNARNRGKGSGKMWVTPVLEVERIRTGETNEDALSHSTFEEPVLVASDDFSAEDTPAS